MSHTQKRFVGKLSNRVNLIAKSGLTAAKPKMATNMTRTKIACGFG